jgi:peptidoglycan/LPS O-acetylase OafA/YrhL
MLFLVIFYLLFVTYSGTLVFGKTMWPFYINLVLFALCLYQLSLVQRTTNIRTKIDRWFGDLSYPIYLNHWFVALVLSYFTHLPRSLLLLAYSIPVILILGLILAKLVELPIEKIRRRISEIN